MSEWGSWIRLSNVEPRDGSTYDQALDLGGALEAGDVVGRGRSRAAYMLAIMDLACRTPVVIDGYLLSSHGTETEQQRGYAVDRHGGLVLVTDGR